jgi:hypothetical protein
LVFLDGEVLLGQLAQSDGGMGNVQEQNGEVKVRGSAIVFAGSGESDAGWVDYQHKFEK